MKKYVFITYGIGGVTGNPQYVSAKTDFLKNNGWEVVVISLTNISEIVLENLKPYAASRIPELSCFPSWYNPIKRNYLLNRLVSIVGKADHIVIESSTLPATVWGELLANRICAKHIVFITDEGIIIKNKKTADFLLWKLRRNEYFSITATAVSNQFRRFCRFEYAEKYHWSASNNVQLKPVPFVPFENLPKADYTILHFGRYKDYFPSMIADLKKFFCQNGNIKFNIFFLGKINDCEKELREIFTLPNVFFSSHDEVAEIPEIVIKKPDIIIASAGCARIAFSNGGKVISMDINKHRPLGLYGYTTLDTNEYSGLYPECKSLPELLSDVLIDRREYTPMHNAANKTTKSFDYQMQFVCTSDGNFYNCQCIDESHSSNRRIKKALTYSGMAELFKRIIHFFVRKNILTSN